jgi:hypothetical protein
MLYLFTFTLIILLLFQYISIVALLIQEDDIIETRFELYMFLIPIIPIVVFILIGIYAIIFNNHTRKELMSAIKNLSDKK